MSGQGETAYGFYCPNTGVFYQVDSQETLLRIMEHIDKTIEEQAQRESFDDFEGIFQEIEQGPPSTNDTHMREYDF